MNNKLFIKPHYLVFLKAIFDEYCPTASILAYGSRIVGDCHTGSDLDLVLIPQCPDETPSINTIKEALTESNIPFFVDIFQFDTLPIAFQEEINRYAIQIYPTFQGSCHNEPEE